jgi:hypothetical protein
MPAPSATAPLCWGPRPGTGALQLVLAQQRRALTSPSLSGTSRRSPARSFVQSQYSRGLPACTLFTYRLHGGIRYRSFGAWHDTLTSSAQPSPAHGAGLRSVRNLCDIAVTMPLTGFVQTNPSGSHRRCGVAGVGAAASPRLETIADTAGWPVLGNGRACCICAVVRSFLGTAPGCRANQTMRAARQIDRTLKQFSTPSCRSIRKCTGA